MNKLRVYRGVALRPLTATQMLWNHRRTLAYLAGKGKWRNLYNHIFVTYLVRGEDCGKGVLDPLWKLTGWAPYLWDIEFEITTRCYLKCTMCEHTYFPKEYLNQDLRFEDFKKVMDEIPNLKWVNLTGEGSSFLNSDFMKILKYCKNRGIYVDLSHDFYITNEDEMRNLISWGVDRLYWSFDGCTKETYEKVRVGSNFEQSIENLKRFVRLKKEMGSPLPEICFRYCFFRDNVHEVGMIPNFLRSLVDDVKDYGDEPSINIVGLMEFKETKGWEREIPKDVISQVDIDAERFGFKVYWSHPTHIEEDKPPLDYCMFWSEPYIMSGGYVLPCCERMQTNMRPELERMSFGSIYKTSLREIWDSKRYREFRKMIVNPKGKVPEVCLGCRVFNTQERARRYGVW